ncbi:MAG: ERCC4 domain-containing protein, partial [Nitrososphaera sp.]
MPAIRIAVDERERSSGIPELLKRAGALIDFAMLPVGDYIVSHDTAVERKTVRDLISSIYDGRLYLQCSDLVKHYERPIMVIQGNLAELDEIPDDIEEKDTRRLAERTPLAYDALATVAIEFRIPIIHSPSARHTAQ